MAEDAGSVTDTRPSGRGFPVSEKPEYEEMAAAMMGLPPMPQLPADHTPAQLAVYLWRVLEYIANSPPRLQKGLLGVLRARPKRKGGAPKKYDVQLWAIRVEIERQAMARETGKRISRNAALRRAIESLEPKQVYQQQQFNYLKNLLSTYHASRKRK